MTPKNHTVKAGYYNPNYYPDVTNTTKFQVERSDITINITQSTINKTSHKINIIKQFIKESLGNKPLIAITTDLYPMYRNIFDDLNIKQQLCIIHLRRTIYTKLKRYTRRNKFTDEEIEKIYKNAKEFTEIFHEKSYNLAKEKFEQYINKYDEIPEVLQQFMNKHVINFIDRYLLYLKDSKIEKTSNKLDNYYRNTDPEIIKNVTKLEMEY